MRTAWADCQVEASVHPNYNAAMQVRDIGEFELIELLESTIHRRNESQISGLRKYGIDVSIGIGDDAAAWSYQACSVVSTTDTMVDGVHFRTGLIPWRDLGWKSLASNLSDVGSMGYSPTFALVTLGLRSDLPVEGLIEMYRGMLDACEYAGGALVGGDIVRSDTFFVTVALEGIAEIGATVMARNAAKPSDTIAVTGALGSSAGGLRLLLDPSSGKSVSDQTRRALIDAHNRPTPRVAEGQALRQLGVRCAMDVSDGLVADLAKLCASSRLSARIDAGLLPVDERLKSVFPQEWSDLALGGGEDYELVFTANDSTMASVKESLGELVTVIGRIESGDRGVTVVDAEGRDIQPCTTGWDHFAG